MVLNVWKKFVSVRNAIVVVIAIFTAGIGSLVLAQSYIAGESDVRYFTKSAGTVLEHRIERNQSDLEGTIIRIEKLQEQQTEVLVRLGRIEEKVNLINERTLRR